MQHENADEALQRRLQEILSRPDLPAFSEHIQQILRSAGDDTSSVRHVTNIVLREYGIGAQILVDLGVKNMVLLTNSRRHQMIGLEGYGLNVVAERPIPEFPEI